MNRISKALVPFAVTSIVAIGLALASGTIDFDKNGHAFVDGQVETGKLGSDPGPGGLSSVLIYQLPFAGTQGDLKFMDPKEGLVDVVRFNGDDTVIYYSAPQGGVTDLSDTPSPPGGFYSNIVDVTVAAAPNPTRYTPKPGQPGYDPSGPTYLIYGHSLASSVPTATPTPFGFGCGPSTLGAVVLAPAKSRPPTIKALNFSRQALGTSNTKNATLTNTTNQPLLVSLVETSGDFTQNNGCTGAPLAVGASCDISVVFAPHHVGSRTGRLTVLTNGPKVIAGLSGTGQAPTVGKFSPGTQAAFSQISTSGLGFAPMAPVYVSYTEHLPHGKKGPAFVVAAVRNADSSIDVTVPPVIDTNGELVAGTATIAVQELLPSGTLTSKSPGTALKIMPPAASTNLQAGVVTEAFLQAEQSFATTLATDVQGTQLGTPDVENALTQVSTASNSLLQALTSGGTPTLGTIAGNQVTVGQAALTMADNQLLSTLETLASSNAPAAAIRRAWGSRALAAGTGCLASEAAAALADAQAGNATAFSTDIANLFNDTLTSAACKQPGPAIAAESIVDLGAGAALGVLNMAQTTGVSGALSSQAISFAGLNSAGQLIGPALALAQPSPQSLQTVINTVNTFNQTISSQLTAVVGQTSPGTLQNSLTSTSAVATSISQATPPFNGSYTGTFSGQQSLGGGVCPISSNPLAFSVSGSDITSTLPGQGSGTLNSDDSAVLTASGGDGTVSCTFTGNFSTNGSSPPSASGTWACTANETLASGLISATGNWSATAQ